MKSKIIPILIILMGWRPLFSQNVECNQLTCVFNPDMVMELDSDDLQEYIVDGGPPPDGIAPIEEPAYISMVEADTFLDDEDMVFIVEADEGIKIYPQIIMVSHEIVNDEFNGKPGSLTYCPLVGVAVGYYSILDGVETTFGTSGKLVNNNLIMYDRLTESYWPQIWGSAIKGEMIYSELDSFPVYWMEWGTATNVLTNAVVLTTNTGFDKSYEYDPYGDYSQNTGYYFDEQIRFPVLNENDEYHPKTNVIGIKSGSTIYAVLKNDIITNKMYELEEAGVVVWYDPDMEIVRVFSSRINERNLTFEWDEGTIKDSETGSVWNFQGEAIEGEFRGSQLEWVESMQAFWFAWYAFYPETLLYKND